MYRCKLCNVPFHQLSVFCPHIKRNQHRANFQFACGMQKSPCTFKKFSSVRSHMHRNHRQSQKQDYVTHRHPQANLHCQVPGCAFVASNFSELCFHLRIHIRDGRKVCCPVEGCWKNFRVRTSFTTHISRKHKQPGPLQQSCLHKLCETATPTYLSLDGQRSVT